MQLFKASATGNDFILIDLLDGASFARDRAAFVRAVCDRHEGVGADGAAFLTSTAGDADFAWDFYNADGSSAEMCGNAARAVGLHAAGRLGLDRLTFRAVGGPVTVRVESAARIEVGLNPLGEVRASPDYVFVRAGVPHAVVEVSSLDDRASLRERAGDIKRRPEFAREGVNVTFRAPGAAGAIRAVTFERGVEDFTRSCGTGAVAAAFAPNPPEGSTVEVQVPGGHLSVICRRERPILIGPARVVARFDWLAD